MLAVNVLFPHERIRLPYWLTDHQRAVFGGSGDSISEVI